MIAACTATLVASALLLQPVQPAGLRRAIFPGLRRVSIVRAQEGVSNVVDGDSEPTVVPAPLHEEVSDSYMAYAMSVIMSRALPDVRDGLKPVHRRILYAMHELGLQPDSPHRKCARVVGEVLGKYHPHGDSSVYDALVRMAQDFSMRVPLVDGHGNFGSIDPDPPAAMRYTECRLGALARDALLLDIDMDTVDFADNFDGSEREPQVLPARLPLLLLNGAAGIAVGMATNCPPHNLGEVSDALVALIKDPEVADSELFSLVKGPDFPTGGVIMGSKGARQVTYPFPPMCHTRFCISPDSFWPFLSRDLYSTGRGSVVVRAAAHVEARAHSRTLHTPTSLPPRPPPARIPLTPTSPCTP